MIGLIFIIALVWVALTMPTLFAVLAAAQVTVAVAAAVVLYRRRDHDRA